MAFELDSKIKLLNILPTTYYLIENEVICNSCVNFTGSIDMRKKKNMTNLGY